MLSLDFLIGDSVVVAICRWLLFTILIVNLPHAFKNNVKYGTGYKVLLFVMIIYCMFYSPDTGDNFTSMGNYYAYLDGTDWEKLHFERLYFYIMDIVPFGYVYYRMVLWGAACCLCVWLLRRLQIEAPIATIAVLCFALPLLLYYQRAAFAYVLLYVALICYLNKGDIFKTIPFLCRHYKIVSIGLLLCTIPFHTSMPIYVTFLLCAYFVPKNKVGMMGLAAALLVFSISLISNSISILEFFNDDTIETGMRSLDGDTGIIGQNLNGAIGDFLHWLPLRTMVLFGIFKMLNQPQSLSQFEKICLVNTLILLVVSFLFHDYSRTIEVKFTNAAMMPWTLYIASYYNRNVGRKECTFYAIATVFTFFI